MSSNDSGQPERFADDGRRFRLESRIATGGMGEVWRATDTVLGREVAVKLLKAEFADDATFRTRFETEARNAAALHHPGVASVFDVGESSTPGTADGSGHPRPFLVMELVSGEPLSTLLQEAKLNHQELDPDVVRDLIAQTGDALGAAHRAGIVHRDVKPANLMVTPQGQVKVTDFGIARAADGVGITRTGAVMGTPQYLSPEQAEGKPATSASDVYALGVVAFECLAGRRPFDAESPVATALAHLREPVPELPSRVPADLAAVVTRALAKDPTERYADGAALARALRDPSASAPPPTAPTARARPVPVPVPVPDPTATQVMGPMTPASEPLTTSTTTEHPDPADDARRNPWPIVAAVVLLVALAVIITLLVVKNSGGSDEPTTPTSSRTRTGNQSDSSEPTSSTATVDIDEGDYVGRNITDVATELSNLGLRVNRVSTANTNPQVNGQVVAVSPSGTLNVGSVVDVRYYADATTPSSPPTSQSPTTPPTSDTPSSPTPPDGSTPPPTSPSSPTSPSEGATS